ncbi:dimethylarginine dimethylaminohydrolase family protein [Lederbergia graminis]|uniref:Dimethylarginine dimethylaminohydrolase family protein n=1 Tax=Lederbergia graminis TaxID=735518 RepID=A0ABW0LFX5_9BACI
MGIQFPIYIDSEYDLLQKVVLCEPTYMEIRDVINATQRKYLKENIDQELAMTQHREFTKKLTEHGVEVILLPASETYPEQVFTRDIGFTVGNKLFIAEMAKEIRKGEENVLKKKLDNKGISFVDLVNGRIEGGDVLVDHKTIYVGLSNRTNEHAVKQLQQNIPDYDIVTIPIDEKYLHLDCVFNILSPKEALIYPEALHNETVTYLASKYELIEVTEEEQFALATNVFSIGCKQVFSMPINSRVNEQLRERGYKVIEVDFSEIIKSGGSFRCCTLPLLRKQV